MEVVNVMMRKMTLQAMIAAVLAILAAGPAAAQLNEETVEFDEDALRTGLAGRRIMVTGAGGSIGGELCRQIGRFGLSELQLVGRGENQIFEIEQRFLVKR